MVSGYSQHTKSRCFKQHRLADNSPNPVDNRSSDTDKASRFFFYSFRIPLLLGLIPILSFIFFLTNPTSLYAQAGAKLVIDVAVDEPEPEPGKTFVYTIRYRCASLTESCVNTVISDPLPDYLEIVSYTKIGGSVSGIDNTDNVITWELESAINNPGELDAGSAGMLFLRVRFPACSDEVMPAAFSEYDNIATIAEDNGDEMSSASGKAVITVPGIPTCTVPVPPPAGDVIANDAGQPVVAPGSIDVRYEMPLPTSPEDPYQIQTDIPEGLTLSELHIGPIIAAGGEIIVTCGGVQLNLAETISGPLNRANDVPEECTTENALATENGVLFTNLESFTLTVPPGVDFGDPLDFVYGLDTGFPVGDVIRNELKLIEPEGTDLNNDGTPGETVTGTVDKIILDSSLMGSIEVINFIKPGFVGTNDESILNENGSLPQQVSTTKTTHKHLDLDSVFLAKNDVVWQIRAQLRNDGSEGMNWEDPLFVHDLPADVDFIMSPNRGNFVQMAILNMSNISPEYDPFDQPECYTPAITKIPNFEGSGRTRVEMRFPGCIIYGGLQQYAGLSFYMSGRLKPGVLAAEKLVSNLRMVSEDGPPLRCFGFDTSYDDYCEASSTLQIAVINSVDSFGFVKGAYDARYQRYPSIGYTNMSGETDYELYITNSGNVAHTSLDLVDVLPFTNDASLINGESRGSTWNMELAGDVAVEKLNPETREWEAVPVEDYATPISYTSSTNPCRLDASGFELQIDESISVAPNGCDASPWSTLVSTAESARTFGFAYAPEDGFAPDDELRIRFQSRYRSPFNICVGIVEENFGTGTGRGEVTAPATTTYAFEGSDRISQGKYMLNNAVGLSDGAWWHTVSEDHTPGDIDGRMLVAASAETPGEFYRTTLSGLTAGQTYVLSFWLANADDNDTEIVPNIKVAIEPVGGGSEISSTTTGPVPNAAALAWNEYSFSVTATAASHDLVLSTQ